MAQVILASQSSQDSSNVAGNPERLINLIAERMNEGSKTQMTLRSVPGQVAFGDTGTVLLRDIQTVNGVLYAVAAGSLLSIDSSGVASVLGSVVDDADTIIAGNGSSVTITAGGIYYVWNGVSLLQPAGGVVVAAGSVGFSGQYTILTEENGNRFEWTGLADPETRDGLNFATCESNNDNIIRVVAYQNYIWLFNQESTEIWYNTGQSGALAFAPLSGGFSGIGLKSTKLAVSFDAGIFFVGNDNVVYLSSASGLVPISAPAVETSINENEPSQCFYYEHRGHKICVLRFSDRPAWCYDFTTGLWHERSSNVTHENWEIVAAVFAYSKWLCGTNVGKIYQMKGVTDIDFPLKRTIVSRPLSMARRFTLAEVELFGGFGDAVFPRSPELMISISKDGGRTYGTEKTRKTGKLGERRKRVRISGLGSSFYFTVKISITDNVDIPIYSEASAVLA